MDKVIEQKFWNRLLSFIMDVQVNDPSSQEEKDMIVTTCKAQMEAPTTPATSWEEVEKELLSRQISISTETNTHDVIPIEDIRKILAQHWPSSQPVSPTPMAETWEEVLADIRNKLTPIANLIALVKKGKHSVHDVTLAENMVTQLSNLSAPSLQQVDRWVKHDWTEFKESEDGKYIDVPDEYMPLFNSIGMQFRLHTISGKDEVATIAHILRKCEQFFLPAAPETDKKEQ